MVVQDIKRLQFLLSFTNRICGHNFPKPNVNTVISCVVSCDTPKSHKTTVTVTSDRIKKPQCTQIAHCFHLNVSVIYLCNKSATAAFCFCLPKNQKNTQLSYRDANVNIYQKLRTGSILDHYAIKYILLWANIQVESNRVKSTSISPINENENKKNTRQIRLTYMDNNRVEGLTFREREKNLPNTAYHPSMSMPINWTVSISSHGIYAQSNEIDRAQANMKR